MNRAQFTRYVRAAADLGVPYVGSIDFGVEAQHRDRAGLRTEPSCRLCWVEGHGVTLLYRHLHHHDYYASSLLTGMLALLEWEALTQLPVSEYMDLEILLS
jgi:hypothetical protein